MTDLKVAKVNFIFENSDEVTVPFSFIHRFTIAGITERHYICDEGNIIKHLDANRIYFSFKHAAKDIMLHSYIFTCEVSFYDRVVMRKDLAQINLLNINNKSIALYELPGDDNDLIPTQKVTDLVGAWELTI